MPTSLSFQSSGHRWCRGCQCDCGRHSDPPCSCRCWRGVTFGLHFQYADTSDCIVFTFLIHTPKPMYDTIWRLLLVRYDLVDCPLYDINLGATHTTTPSTRGVQIPIDLVSSTTDSFWRRVVLFKPVRIPTSDPKSEFLCQSSIFAQNLQTPPESPRTPGISPTPSSPRIIRTLTTRVRSLST